MAKLTVNSLDEIIQACCHDLLGATGYSDGDKGQEPPAKAGYKGKNASTNADLFLKTSDASTSQTLSLSDSHRAAAERLLEGLLTNLPRQHVKKAQRALMDRSAILSRARGAMLASALNPYVDRSGRLFANVLPFLSHQVPHDQGVEILRSNLRLKPRHFGDVDMLGDGDGRPEEEEEPGAERTAADMTFQPGWSNRWGTNEASEPEAAPAQPGFGLDADDMAVDSPATGTTQAETTATADVDVRDGSTYLTLKRKNEAVDPVASKRLDTGNVPAIPLEQKQAIAELAGDEAGDSNSDSEGSVHLDMTLDDDEEDE